MVKSCKFWVLFASTWKLQREARNHPARKRREVGRIYWRQVLELWAGHECTVNRVGNVWRDQTRLTGHHDRIEDLTAFARLRGAASPRDYRAAFRQPAGRSPIAS